MNNKKSNKSAILAVAILLVLVIAAITAYFVLKPPARERHPVRIESSISAESANSTPAEAPQAQPEEPASQPEEPEAVADEPADEDLVTIAVAITHGDESTKEISITTSGLTLREALEQEDLIEGSESEYGLFVTSVDGEEADSALQQWWCFSLNGEDLMTGVDSTFIADGDHYEIVLKTGW